MPKYKRYAGEPKAKADARIKRNLSKKKGKKKKSPKKDIEIAVIKRTREGRRRRTPGRPGKMEHYV